MELVDPDPARLDARDLVVRERAAGALLLAGLMLAVAAGWTLAPWCVGDAPLWSCLAVSGLIGLPLCWIAAVLARGAARGMRTGRWTLRIGEQGLWLHPRSFLNEAPGRAPAAWIRID